MIVVCAWDQWSEASDGDCNCEFEDMGALKGKRVGWSDSGQRFRTAIAYDLVGLLGRNVGGEGKKDGKYRQLEQFEEIWKGGSTRLSVPRRGYSL